MTIYLGLTIVLNLVSAVLVLAVFALAKKVQNLQNEVLKLKQSKPLASDYIKEEGSTYEPEVKDAPLQSVSSRYEVQDDWKPGELREKPAKSLSSETLGQPTDKFTRARELLAQGHGMKEVSVVTGLSFSELALLSKTSF